MKQFTVTSESAQVMYERLARFFAAQGYRTERQVPNQRLRVRIERAPAMVYGLVGLAFLAPQLVIVFTTLGNPAYYLDSYLIPATALCGLPTALLAVAWLLWAMPARITLRLSEAGPGTTIAADVRGLPARAVMNRLAGSLALLA